LIGSSAVVGNNLTDTGATPLSEHTLLVGKHWNVANSIITGQFVRRANSAAELGLIILLSLAVALLIWQARILRASLYVGVIFVVYLVLAFILYLQTRYWIPIVLPLTSGLVCYVALLAWRLVFEEAERRRIKSIFGTVVSEKIMNVLLGDMITAQPDVMVPIANLLLQLGAALISAMPNRPAVDPISTQGDDITDSAVLDAFDGLDIRSLMAALGAGGLLMNGTGLVCAASRVQSTAKMTVKIIAFPKGRMHTSRSVVSQPSVGIDDDHGKSGRTQPEGVRTSACNNQCPSCSQAASALPARRGLPHARNYNSLYG